MNFAYTSHAAPALGDKVPFVVALQDENAQPAKGVLTVRGALGDVTFESTRIDGGALDVGPDGALNGILRENALYRVTFSIPKAASPAALADALCDRVRAILG